MHRLLKLPKERTRKKKTPGPKQGMAFQRQVLKQTQRALQPKPQKKVAWETPASGAFDGMPGDIVTEEMLQEVKQRNSMTTRGAKTISIQREWLEKAATEQAQSGKLFFCLPFGFKGDTEAKYAVVDFNQLLELVYQNRSLRDMVEKLQHKEE